MGNEKTEPVDLDEHSERSRVRYFYGKALPQNPTAKMISAGIGWREKDPREETASDDRADMVDRIYRCMWDAYNTEPLSELSPTLSCDDVSWILTTIRGYVTDPDERDGSRRHEMLCLGLLYEIMEIAGLEFEDASAVHNATPKAVRRKVGDSISRRTIENATGGRRCD